MNVENKNNRYFKFVFELKYCGRLNTPYALKNVYSRFHKTAFHLIIFLIIDFQRSIGVINLYNFFFFNLRYSCIITNESLQ